MAMQRSRRIPLRKEMDPYFTVSHTKDFDEDEKDLLCRLCARPYNPDSCFHIESDNQRILFMIKTCLPIDVNPSDPFSKIICQECNDYLDLTFHFQDVAIKAQEIFKIREDEDSSSTSSTVKSYKSQSRKRKRKSKKPEKSALDESVKEAVADYQELCTVDPNNSNSTELLEEIGDVRHKRGFAKRRHWSDEEKEIMLKHFASFIVNQTLPSFHLCSMVRQLNPVLRNRSNSIMKAWVYNQQRKQKPGNTTM